MIIKIYSKDNNDIDTVKTYIQDHYSISVTETSNINWGNGSDLSDYYKFLDLGNTNLNISDIQKNTNIYIQELPNGNSFYEEEITYHTLIDYTNVFEHLINDKVKEYQYDSITTACSYVNSTIDKFRNESLAFVHWRDYLWSDAVNQITLELNAGKHPSIEEFVNSLRTYESFLNTGA